MKKLWMRNLALPVLAVGGFVGANAGDILLNQLPVAYAPGEQINIANGEFTDFPDFNIYTVVDINTGPGWLVDTIRLFGVGPQGSGGWTSARLNVFVKTGSSPTAGNNPAGGEVISITTVNLGGNSDGSRNFELIASGLNRTLDPGEYWIGFAPMGEFGANGQFLHSYATAMNGEPGYVRNPSGGFGIGTDWTTTSGAGQSTSPEELAIRIEGQVIPEPATMIALGAGLAALAARRRKSAR